MFGVGLGLYEGGYDRAARLEDLPVSFNLDLVNRLMLVPPYRQVHPLWDMLGVDTFEGRRPGSEPLFIAVLMENEKTKVLLPIF